MGHPGRLDFTVTSAAAETMGMSPCMAGDKQGWHWDSRELGRSELAGRAGGSASWCADERVFLQCCCIGSSIKR